MKMKRALKWVILLLLFLILFFTTRGIFQESQIRKGQENSNMQEENQQEEEKKEQPKNKLKLVATQYKGYKVAANLKIDKLKIDTCVLEDYTKNAMEVCVTKFFGPNPNEIGNFCITGHNYITKNMFGYLYTLNKGDTFTLTDNQIGTIKYKIYDKYKVNPTQTYRIVTKNKWKKGSNLNYLLQLL